MRWRKATWAIVVWTALMMVVILGPVSQSLLQGVSTDATGPWLIGVPLVWVTGLVVLVFIWLVSRPPQNTMVHGPQGQQVLVTEKEAKRRVEEQGWTYQSPRPPAST